MEVIKNMTEDEIVQLRGVFSEFAEGLNIDHFERVLLDAVRRKPQIDASQLHLRQLFSEIDVSGDGQVHWDEFITYILQRTEGKHKAAGAGLEGVVKNYVLQSMFVDEVPKTIAKMTYIPKINKIVKLVRNERHAARLRIAENDMRLTPWIETPKRDAAAMCYEYVPRSGLSIANCLAVSYSDSYIRFFDLQKRRLNIHNEARLVKETRVPESQTCMVWSARYERLVLGSRTGIVSVLHPDEAAISTQEKLHSLLVSDMVIHDALLFSASVDPVRSVKCIDLQRSVVRYSLDDHPQGATLLALNTTFQQLFSVGFEQVITSRAMLMPRMKPFKLHDSGRPHRGRITHLAVVPDTPQLISSDSYGLTKVWDVRTNQCVQSIAAPKDELDITPPEQCSATSLCVVGRNRRLVVNGRHTAIYCYEGAADPSLVDEIPAHLVVYNNATHTFLTVHGGSIRLWDAINGELRGSFRNAMKGDEITCVSLIPPMERRMFCGSYHGRLAKFSFSMCEFEYELTHMIPECMKGEELLSLIPLSNFRESGVLYVAAASKKNIALLPDVEEEGTVKQVYTITALQDALPSHALITAMVVRDGDRMLVGASDGSIRMIDLQTLYILSTFTHPQFLRGDVVSLSFHALVDVIGSTALIPGLGLSNPSVLFATDGGGSVTCAVALTSSSWELLTAWDGTDHCETKQTFAPNSVMSDEKFLERVVKGGGAGGMERSMAVHAPSPPPPSSAAGPRRGKSSVRLDSSTVGAPVRSSMSVSGAPEGFIAGQSIAPEKRSSLAPSERRGLRSKDSERDRLLSSCIIAVKYINELQLLITGDEKGAISVWCFAEVFRQFTASLLRPNSSQGNGQLRVGTPKLVHWWRAHDDDLAAMHLFQEPSHRRYVIATSSHERKLRLWSLDGVNLGSLAAGRESEAVETSAAIIDQYLYGSRVAEYWEKVEAHLEAVPRSMDLHSNNNLAPSTIGISPKPSFVMYERSSTEFPPPGTAGSPNNHTNGDETPEPQPESPGLVDPAAAVKTFSNAFSAVAGGKRSMRQGSNQVCLTQSTPSTDGDFFMTQTVTEFGRHDSIAESMVYGEEVHLPQRMRGILKPTAISARALATLKRATPPVRLGGQTQQLPQLSPRQTSPHRANTARSISDWWDGDQRNAPLLPPPMPSPRERIFRSMVPFGDGCRPEDVMEPVVKVAVRGFSNRDFAKVKESNNTHAVIQRCRHRQGPQTALDLLEAKGVLTLTSDPTQPGLFVEAATPSRSSRFAGSTSLADRGTTSPHRKQRGRRVPPNHSPHLKTEDSLGNPLPSPKRKKDSEIIHEMSVAKSTEENWSLVGRQAVSPNGPSPAVTVFQPETSLRVLVSR